MLVFQLSSVVDTNIHCRPEIIWSYVTLVSFETLQSIKLVYFWGKKSELLSYTWMLRGMEYSDEMEYALTVAFIIIEYQVLVMIHFPLIFFLIPSTRHSLSLIVIVWLFLVFKLIKPFHFFICVYTYSCPVWILNYKQPNYLT